MSLTGALMMALALPAAHALQKEIYGADDRRDLYEVPAVQQEWARASAALVMENELQGRGGQVQILSRSMGSALGVCTDERFVSQPSAGTCSGFLVAPDLVATAGHCINPMEEACGPRVWVFDFAVASPGQKANSVPAESVYRCTEVLGRVFQGGSDWALIKLERPVVGRKPLSLRWSGKVAQGDPLVLVGHPWGLPVKVAGGAVVRGNSSRQFFSSDLDAMARNSGSAVINGRTGEVEGILVRGHSDSVRDERAGCVRPSRCPNSDCKFVESTRITEMTSLLK